MVVRRSLVLAVALLAGCAAPGGLSQPRFGLQATAEDAAAPTTTRAAAVAGARVTVSVASVLQRRLLATLADVDHVAVALRPSLGGTPRMASLDHAALLAGTTTVTFDGVPLGAYFAEIQALDPSGRVVGGATVQAVVNGPSPITVNAAIQLEPTVTQPPAPTGGGGSGGGGAPTTGALGVAVTLADGLELWSLRDLLAFSTPSHHPDRVLYDHGQVWSFELNAPADSYVERYDADGTLLGGADVPSYASGQIAFDPAGTAWFPTPDGVVRIKADGTVMPALKPAGVNGNFNVGAMADGRMMLVCDSEPVIRVLDAAGQTQATLTVPNATGVTCVAQDHLDRIWATDGEHHLYVLASGGQLLASASMPQDFWPSDLVIDAQDQAWLSCILDPRLLKYRADAQLLTTVDAGFPTFGPRVDANGDLWVGLDQIQTSPPGDTLRHPAVARYATDGSLVGRYVLPPSDRFYFFGLGAPNELWIGGFDGTVQAEEINRLAL